LSASQFAYRAEVQGTQSGLSLRLGEKTNDRQHSLQVSRGGAEHAEWFISVPLRLGEKTNDRPHSLQISRGGAGHAEWFISVPLRLGVQTGQDSQINTNELKMTNIGLFS
jgi:hypothetical protein